MEAKSRFVNASRSANAEVMASWASFTPVRAGEFSGDWRQNRGKKWENRRVADMKRITLISLIILSLALSQCAILPKAQPTPTNTVPPTDTSTFTPTLTYTSTLTITPTLAPTKTNSSTPVCDITNGDWESHETASSFGIELPILQFSIDDCVIASWSTLNYPIPGELFIWEGSKFIPIMDNQFTTDVDTGDGIFTFEGAFDSASACHGKMKFPKGFSVFGSIVKNEVVINWTTSPKK
jgi:hypothetical protein